MHLFSSEEKIIIVHSQKEFENVQPTYCTLRKSIVHNEVNDNNIIVSNEVRDPKVRAIIDFGDAIYTQTINDLVLCAYAVMAHNNPLDAALSI